MDITGSFKSIVKNKKCSNAARMNNKHINQKDDYFAKEVNQIVRAISELKNFVCRFNHEQDDSFISTLNSSLVSQMAEEESTAYAIVNHCIHLLSELSSYIQTNPKKAADRQLYFHQNEVLKTVRSYVNSIWKMYSKYRSLYLRRSKNYCAMSLISTPASSSASFDEPKFTPNSVVRRRNNERQKSSENIQVNDDLMIRNLESDSACATTISSTNSYGNGNDINLLTTTEMSTDEIQLFDLENDVLINDLNGIMSEVGQIQQKAVHLAKLQDVFMREVLQQDGEIERIDKAVLGTSQNVIDANELLSDTIRQNTGVRIYLLFVILVLSFSLLFLNWYND